MSVVLEVKMVNDADSLKILVPRTYFRQLGLKRGDTLLATIEDEGLSRTRKNRRIRN